MMFRFLIQFGACLLFAVSVVRGADTSLADAAEHKDYVAVSSLVKAGSDINAAQLDGMTALHWATYHDDTDSVKLLITAGANVQTVNRYGVCPLTLACTNGNTEVVELLLEAGADPHATGPGGETALMTAARTGRIGPVAALLARGAKVDAHDERGQTAVMWAAAAGHGEVVTALLAAGADYHTPLASGFTPLFFAAREGRIDVVLRLVRAEADVDEVMKLKRSDDPNAIQATNALNLAVENGHFELAVALLEAGADPNARPAGYTALHAITWVRKPLRGDGNPPPRGSGKISSEDFVRKLVEAGADINARLEKGVSELGRFTTTGSTPFLMAARASDVPLMKLLIELGVDPTIPNADNCTPLLAAAGVGALGDGDESAGTEEEAIEAVRMLLDLGADINAVDDNGETALHGAAYQSRAKLVQFLVGHGADIDIWNRQNKALWTPLMIAQGHRPGNFRPAPDTIAAIAAAMRAAGVEPPKATREADLKNY